jgi:hypothetical protein
MIKYALSDGGRGAIVERLDCAVRALATAMDIPYYQAYKVFEHSGRKPRHKSYNTINALNNLGLIIIYDGRTLTAWLKDHSIGNFIVHKRGHLFAVKNGIVYDLAPVSGRTQVQWYAEVKG